MLKRNSNSGSTAFPESTWWERLAARIVARVLLRHHSFQVCGKVNWLVPASKMHNHCTRNYRGEADIQVPATSVAHWVLRSAGYSVCEMDIIEGRAP